MTIRKKFVVSFLLYVIVVLSSLTITYAGDTVEIKNGVRTTYAEKPRPVIDTIGKNYDLKWTLNKEGKWKLLVRRKNGYLVQINNSWVIVERDVYANAKVVDSYYFDYFGNMVVGWYVDTEGNKYFLNTDNEELGRMVRGWKRIGDGYYYFNQLGIMQCNTVTPDGYFVDAEGKWRYD